MRGGVAVTAPHGGYIVKINNGKNIFFCNHCDDCLEEKMMETRKNKQIFNIIMVVMIVLIAVGGVIGVGSIKGWFNKAEKDAFSYADKIAGICHVERDGVSFELKKATELKKGDIIETGDKSTAKIISGKNRDNLFVLSTGTKIKVKSVDKNVLSLSLLSGEVFVSIDDSEAFDSITADGWKFTEEGTVFSVNLQTGSMSVNVFEGNVTGQKNDSDLTAKAGKAISIVGDKAELIKLTIDSLNQFNLENIIEANKTHKLIFSNEEVNKLIEKRKNESGNAEGSKIKLDGEVVTNESETETKVVTEVVTDKSGEAVTDKSGEAVTKKTTVIVTKKGESVTTTKKDETTTKKGETTTKKITTTKKPTTPKVLTCTIEIRCDTILNNMEDLKDGKEVYVPSDGTILPRTTVEFKDGETVFDVLKRACASKNIQLEYEYTPVYGSYYLQGINNLYEFDCGEQSGWMYKVNGWFPNYGCSSYKLSEGDTIVWCYTCKGLGADVGNEWMGQ